MTVMFDTINLPGRGPIARKRVPVRLVSGSVGGLLAADKVTIIRTVWVATDEDGRWELDLDPNESFEQAGTYYTVTYPDGSQESFNVPTAGGPQWVGDNLVTVGPVGAAPVSDPQARAEVAAHLADGVDAHDASAISFTPSGGIVAVEVQSAVVEARSDALAYTDTEVALKAPLASPAFTGTATLGGKNLVTAAVDATGGVTLYAGGAEL